MRRNTLYYSHIQATYDNIYSYLTQCSNVCVLNMPWVFNYTIFNTNGFYIAILHKAGLYGISNTIRFLFLVILRFSGILEMIYNITTFNSWYKTYAFLWKNYIVTSIKRKDVTHIKVPFFVKDTIDVMYIICEVPLFIIW